MDVNETHFLRFLDNRMDRQDKRVERVLQKFKPEILNA
jgi:hypothetical protein